MGGLRLGPTAEYRIDRDQLRNVRKLLCVASRYLRISGTVKVRRRNLLSLLGVQILQISLGHLTRAVLVDVLIHDADRRFRDDAKRRRDDIEFGGSRFLLGKKGFVFPGK